MRAISDRKRLFALAAAVSAALGGQGTQLRANDYPTTGATNSWDLGTNWSDGHEPTSTEDVQFLLRPVDVSAFVRLNDAEVAQGITFLDYYSLQGSSLAISTGTINVDGGPVVVPGGGVAVGLSPVSVGLNSASINSMLVNPSGGPAGLTKNGTGTLFLNTVSPALNNTFGGAGQTVSVGGGRLSITSDGALGNAANTVALNGGMLTIADTAVLTRAISVSSSGGTIDVVANPNVPNRAAVLFGAGFSTTGTTNLLTKTGTGVLNLGSANGYTGQIEIATSGGTLRVAGASGTLASPNFGSITAASRLTVNPGGTFAIDNNAGVGPAIGPSGIPSTGTAPAQANVLSSTDRVADSVPIFLQGGSLTYSAASSVNNPAAIRETLGTVTLNTNQSGITVTSNGGQNLGGEIAINTLNRNFGTTLNISVTGTAGATGNNGRLILGAVNNSGNAVTLPTSGGLLGGWLTLNANDFVGYTTYVPATQTGGVTLATYDSSNTTAAFASGKNTNLTTNLALTGSATTGSLRMANGTTTVGLTFAAAGDVLNIESGGLLSDNQNGARNIGTTTVRGVITAGGASGSGPVELITYQNQGTMTINSVITDNGGRALSLIKNYGGGLTVTAQNTYTGGTFIYNSGDVNVSPTTSVVGGLGTGRVVVSNSRLIINTNIGAVNNNAGWDLTTNPTYLIQDNGQINFASNANTALPTGQTIRLTGNSVLRVDGATTAQSLILSGAGQNVNADFGTTLAQTTTAGIVQQLKGLGTTPRYFFGFGGSTTENLTVGDGTPWIGISTDRSNNTVYNGGTGTTNNTITYNSDFTIQTPLLNSAYSRTFTLGVAGAGGVVRIVPGSATSAKVSLGGNVTFANEQSVYEGVTFIGLPGSTVTLGNIANALGGGGTNDATQIAGLVMQQGSLLDVNGVSSTAINGQVTLEPGSTIRLDDNPAAGVFNNPNGPTVSFQPGSYIQMQVAGGVDPYFALQGSQLPAVIPSGVILRLNGNTTTGAGINGFGALNVSGVNSANSISVNSATGKFTSDIIVEAINGGTNTITSSTNDPLKDNIYISGGILTATYNGGTLNGGGGRIIVGPAGVTLAPGAGLQPPNANSANSTFNISEDFDLPVAGRTLTVGSTATIDGIPKANGYVFLSAQGSRSVAGGIVRVTGGAQAQANAFYVVPDLATLQIDAGSSLLLNTSGATETVGRLTGSGPVVCNVSNNGTPNTFLQVGYGDQDSQYDGGFLAAGTANATAPFATQNFLVSKIGSGTFTLTGTSTTTATFNQNGGTTALTGPNGKWAFSISQLTRGTLSLDNSGTVLPNRLGNGQRIRFGGGTLQLVGGGTAVTETVGQFDVDGGGTSVVDLTTPGAGVTLNTTNLSGRSITTLLFRGPLGGASKFTAPFTAPAVPTGFTNSTGNVATAINTVQANVRADFLHDNGTAGTDLAFVTYDPTNGARRLTSAELTSSLYAGQNTTGTGQPASSNVQVSGTTTLSFPVSAISGQLPALGADTQMQSMTVAAGSTLTQSAQRNAIGGLTRLNVNSGGILVQGGAGTATITAPYLVNPLLNITNVGDLTLNTLITNGGSGFTKAGPGTLRLGTGALANMDQTNISLNGGTTVLGANSDTFANPAFNSAFFLSGTTGYGVRSLWLNTANLDLNGNAIIVGQLSSSNYAGAPTQISGGNIINSGAPADISTNSSQIFAGTISGVRNFNKFGGNTTLLQNTVTLSGDLTVRGGTLSLREGGKVTMPSSSTISINTAVLSLNNVDTLNNNQDYTSGVASSLVTNRIPSDVAINLSGGQLQFRSAGGVVDSQTFGNTGNGSTGVNLVRGANVIDANVAGNSSSNVTVSNLVRDGSNARSFVNFTGSNLGNSGELYGVSHIVIGKFNGDAFDSAPTLSNNIIGPWAVVNGSNWATYRSSSTVATVAQPFGYGVSNLGNTSGTAANNQGFAGYSANALTAGVAADNINVAATITDTGSRQINTLRIAGNFNVTLAASEVLTLGGGGFLTDTNNAISLSAGTLTSTYKSPGAVASASSELYVWVNQSTTTINSVIADNAAGGGAGAVTLIKAGPATLTLTGSNTHSGGSIFSQATTNLSTASANGTSTTATGTGNVTLNGSVANATVVNATTAGQIANTAVVTFNGGNTTLNLQSAAASATTTTLGGLVFNNNGGSANAPTLSIATLNTAAGGGTLVLNGDITSTNDNFLNVPTITQSVGGTAGTTPVAILDLGNATRTITTNGSSFLGLNIQAAVANGGIIKEGPGTLGLGVTTANLVGGGSTSTLTGGITINNGIVRVDSVGALGASGGSGNTVMVNPNGILAANLTGNITGNIMLAGGKIQGIANVTPVFTGNVSITANSTISSQDYFFQSFNRAMTFSGPITVSGTPTLSVVAAQNSATTGTLLLTNNTNNLTGATIAMTPNSVLTAQSSATDSVGSTIAGAAINMAGGQLNLQIGGLTAVASNSTLALNNPITVTGNAQIQGDRGSSTTATANTLQLGALTLGSGSDLTFTSNTGNNYVLAFNGTTLANGQNIGWNASGGFTNSGALSGTPASFTKYGAGVLTVPSYAASFASSSTPVTVAAGLMTTTSGNGTTAMTAGTLKVGLGAELRQSSGTGNVVTYASSTVTSEGNIRANTGTMNLGGKFINAGTAATSNPFSTSFSEKWFIGAWTDTNITLETGTNFTNQTPTTTGALTRARTTFQSVGGANSGTTQMMYRARTVDANNGVGLLMTGQFTVGGVSGTPSGVPISFGLASDDGAAMYVDYDKNGSFSAGELLINNRGGHGIQNLANATPVLADGTYTFAVAYYNTQANGNTGGLEVRYAPGVMGAGLGTPNPTGTILQPANGYQPIPFVNQQTITPSAVVTSGVAPGIAPAGNLQVDANAKLITGGFDADTVVLFPTTTAATTSTLQIDNTSSAASTAQVVFVNGTSGSAALQVDGSRTLTIATSLGITSGSTLQKTGSGTLLVNAAFANGGGAVVANAGTIGGNGSIAGPLTINSGANLAPGNSAGVLTVNNTGTTTIAALTMTNLVNGAGSPNAASKYTVEITGSGTTAGTDYDQLKVIATNTTPAAANVALGSGVANLIVSMLGTVPSGNQYVIIDNATTGNTTGNFAGLPEGSTVTVGVQEFTITYAGTAPGESVSSPGNDVILTATVPEPASIGLAGLAAFGLLARRRRRNA